MASRIFLFPFVYIWFALLLLLPLSSMVIGAFSGGIHPFLQDVTSPEALFSLKLTCEVTAIAVAINTVFGVLTAFWIARKRRGWTVVNAVTDLPFAVSPVIAGVALVAVYGPNTFLGGLASAHGIHVLFAFPGILLATLFVTLPTMVRELAPVLSELGITQEEASATLGASSWRTFWQVTLPTIRWTVVYGLVQTMARALGEFGAVLVVSGAMVMVTETATIYIYQAITDNQMQAAFAVSLVLALVSFVVLGLLQVIRNVQGVAANEH